MRTRWLTIETVKGEPLTVGSRTLVPLARRVVLRFDVGSRQGMGGAHVEHVQPIGVIERIGEVEQRVPIEDVTGAALRWVLITGIVVSALAWLARRVLGHGKESV
ncbi:MAG: hypothetical protein E6J26_05315 [Chloroflexi bacterium]|nr:MAG: hypothetical protein E6J26_05315 [Chloroflexota bacterium]